jgi:hypothetical protein
VKEAGDGAVVGSSVLAESFQVTRLRSPERNAPAAGDYLFALDTSNVLLPVITISPAT